MYCIYLTSKLSDFVCNHDIQISESGNPFYLEKPSLSFFYIIRKRTQNTFSVQLVFIYNHEKTFLEELRTAVSF